jgi:hypothetical protein
LPRRHPRMDLYPSACVQFPAMNRILIPVIVGIIGLCAFADPPMPKVLLDPRASTSPNPRRSSKPSKPPPPSMSATWASTCRKPFIAPAQFSYSKHLLESSDTVRAEGVAWLERSVAGWRSDLSRNVRLAQCSMDGIGTSIKPKEAYRWMLLTAKLGADGYCWRYVGRFEAVSNSSYINSGIWCRRWRRLTTAPSRLSMRA